jgi:hypothetical protein
MGKDFFAREFLGVRRKAPDEKSPEQREDEYYIELADSLLPFTRRHCRECKGTGKVLATNVPVPTNCRLCSGTGYLRDVPEAFVRHYIRTPVSRPKDCKPKLESVLRMLVDRNRICDFRVTECSLNSSGLPAFSKLFEVSMFEKRGSAPTVIQVMFHYHGQ